MWATGKKKRERKKPGRLAAGSRSGCRSLGLDGAQAARSHRGIERLKVRVPPVYSQVCVVVHLVTRQQRYGKEVAQNTTRRGQKPRFELADGKRRIRSGWPTIQNAKRKTQNAKRKRGGQQLPTKLSAVSSKKSRQSLCPVCFSFMSPLRVFACSLGFLDGWGLIAGEAMMGLSARPSRPCGCGRQRAGRGRCPRS